MKTKEVIEAANSIGSDSYPLINFDQLPETATRQEQAEALEADQRWQEDHHTEIDLYLSALISGLSD